MNKYVKLLITAALCVTTLAAVGCGGSQKTGAVDNSKPVKVGVNPDLMPLLWIM
jgi:hypothetical protein